MKIKPNENLGVIAELGPNEEAIPGWSTSLPPVFQIRRLLVPVDFSECSGKAMEMAIPMARQLNAELVLLHVVEPTPANAELLMLEAEAVGAAKQELEKMRASQAMGVRARTIVREGYAHAEIVKATDELGVDLVVIGTHGRTGLAHVLLGSTAEKVVRYSPCPVLVVPERNKSPLRNAK